MPNNVQSPNSLRAANKLAIDRVVEAYDGLHAWLTRAQVPHFLELNLTLAQLKALFVIAATGPMRMSQVAQRLGTAPSSTSGVVDGLVQLDLLERLQDAGDRRQVLVRATPAARDRLEDFYELGRRRLRELLSRVEEADDLATIERSIRLLTDAAGHLTEDTTE